MECMKLSIVVRGEIGSMTIGRFSNRKFDLLSSGSIHGCSGFTVGIIKLGFIAPDSYTSNLDKSEGRTAIDGRIYTDIIVIINFLSLTEFDDLTKTHFRNLRHTIIRRYHPT